MLARLQAQAERIERLLALLDDERAQLARGQVDGEALEQLTTHKQALLDAVAAFEHDHHDALARIERAAPAAADDDDCRALRRHIRTRAREAARRNRLNGELIQIRMTSNQRLLNDLQTLAGKDLYGPDGRASSGGQHTSPPA